MMTRTTNWSYFNGDQISYYGSSCTSCNLYYPSKARYTFTPESKRKHVGNYCIKGKKQQIRIEPGTPHLELRNFNNILHCCLQKIGLFLYLFFKFHISVHSAHNSLHMNQGNFTTRSLQTLFSYLIIPYLSELNILLFFTSGNI